MLLRHLAADSEADARPGILVLGMQALEDVEDALVLGGVDADAIVAHRDPPRIAVAGTVHADPRLAAVDFSAFDSRFWNSSASRIRSR